MAKSTNETDAVRNSCNDDCANSSDAKRICAKRTAGKCCRPEPVAIIFLESTVIPRWVGHGVVLGVVEGIDLVKVTFVGTVDDDVVVGVLVDVNHILPAEERPDSVGVGPMLRRIAGGEQVNPSHQ